MTSRSRPVEETTGRLQGVRPIGLGFRLLTSILFYESGDVATNPRSEHGRLPWRRRIQAKSHGQTKAPQSSGGSNKPVEDRRAKISQVSPLASVILGVATFSHGQGF